jgi:hypothetical protein
MFLIALAGLIATGAGAPAPADASNPGYGQSGSYGENSAAPQGSAVPQGSGAPQNPALSGYTTTDAPQIPHPPKSLSTPPAAPLPSTNDSMWVGHDYQFDTYLYLYCTLMDQSQMRTFYSNIKQLEWIEIEGDEGTQFLKSVQSLYSDATGQPTCSWNMDRYYQQDTIKHSKFSDILGGRSPIDVEFLTTR